MYTLFPTTTKAIPGPSSFSAANEIQREYRIGNDMMKRTQYPATSGKSEVNVIPRTLWSALPLMSASTLTLKPLESPNYMDPIAKSKLTSRAAEPVLAKSSPILWDIEPSFPSLGCNSDLASKTFLENGSSLGYGPAVYSSEGYSQRVLFTGIYDHHHITAPIGTGRMQQGRQSSPSPLSTPSLLPLKEESPYVGHVGGALFDSLSREFSRINLEPGADSPKQYLVVKLSNIPWTASTAEIEELLCRISLPEKVEHAQSIHILIDKFTGKTLGDAYIELNSEEDVTKLSQELRHARLRGRRLSIKCSSQDELLSSLFPKWPGTFSGGHVTLEPQYVESIGGQRIRLPPLVTSAEYESLLAICRDYRGHYSRKCGERPFENFISLLVKYPFHEKTVTTTLHRDHLYEYYKLAARALRRHLSTHTHRLSWLLLDKMIRAAVQCPHLTIPQKRAILAASDMECPPDIAYLLIPPPEEVEEDQ
ncbi:hypothetical protein VTP01DRAFT_4023 [Rhizomucor pusillus]|uniref:uncharacterized protein n=1 Tax=Rhizomucor pusillus TaxID=4840 RepID=UPI003742594F